ncbi:MAG: cytochrome b5-like heme/steroid binding domain-containing protein [Candidatus Roizmanbacteria bacterium]|nr:cytochrome b5-like heme/steroid binding domain-containing protein [Candidatus Roizmanbacteria bacterium]
MHKYLRQLTQISILNFFFILGLYFFIQNRAQVPQKKMIEVKQLPSTSSVVIPTLTEKNVPITIFSTQAPQKNLFTELSSHNTKSNCWLGVGGHIYDVTTYFGSHPGGDGPIQKYCGTDATIAFQSKDGIGANHSATAYDLLAQYLIQ